MTNKGKGSYCGYQDHTVIIYHVAFRISFKIIFSQINLHNRTHVYKLRNAHAQLIWNRRKEISGMTMALTGMKMKVFHKKKSN